MNGVGHVPDPGGWGFGDGQAQIEIMTAFKRLAPIYRLMDDED